MTGPIRRFLRWIRPAALILRYHRISDLPADPHPVCVSPGHFAQQLEILRRHRPLISLEQLTAALERHSVPHGAVAVTFDDGYADNLYHAKPLLERFDVPATVFVTTGPLRRRREFWWDELEQILLRPSSLPNRLKLEIDRIPHEWDLPDACDGNAESSASHRAWNLRAEHDPTPRHRLYRTLHGLLKTKAVGEQDRVLDELAAWAGVTPSVRETHRSLTADEIIRLADGGGIDIGAHTISHPVLSQFPAAVQRNEIVGSKIGLEQILGRRITSFAYPYGSRADFTEETVAIVQDAGFACACSTKNALIRKNPNRMTLGRLYVGNWPAAEFFRNIESAAR